MAPPSTDTGSLAIEAAYTTFRVEIRLQFTLNQAPFSPAVREPVLRICERFANLLDSIPQFDGLDLLDIILQAAGEMGYGGYVGAVAEVLMEAEGGGNQGGGGVLELEGSKANAA